VVPLTLRYVPGGTSVAGSTLYWTSISSDVSPKFHPARNAARFASSEPGRLANFPRSQRSVGSVGRSYSHETTPSANRFLARPASRVETCSIASVARAVSEVIGIRITW
jgi:hypothetical protein